MEEDIKILEKLMEDGKEDFTDTRLSDCEIKSIKNLIARYKELEYKLREHICIEAHEQVKQLYIPKSKVQERIAELQEGCKNCNFRGSICKDFKAFNQCTFQLTIKNLQELLED